MTCIDLHPHEASCLNRTGRVVVWRLVEPQPDVGKRRHRWVMQVNEHGVLQWGRAPWRITDPYNFYVEQEIKCPLGQPGDVLNIDGTDCELRSVSVRQPRDATEEDAVAAGCEGERWPIGHGDYNEYSPWEEFLDLLTIQHGDCLDDWFWTCELERKEA